MVRGMRIGETVLGVLMLALGGYMLIETAMTPPLVARTVIGPGVFPGLIGTGVVLVGLRLLYEALVKRGVAESFPEVDWKAVLIMAGAFLVVVFVLEYLGWVISGTFLFLAGAYAFGSRRWLASLLLGLVLTLTTYFVFDYGLDLDLPTGWLVEEAMAMAGPRS